MYEFMFSKIVLTREGLAAGRAGEWSLARVRTTMSVQMARTREQSATGLALVATVIQSVLPAVAVEDTELLLLPFR